MLPSSLEILWLDSSAHSVSPQDSPGSSLPIELEKQIKSLSRLENLVHVYYTVYVSYPDGSSTVYSKRYNPQTMALIDGNLSIDEWRAREIEIVDIRCEFVSF